MPIRLPLLRPQELSRIFSASPRPPPEAQAKSSATYVAWAAELRALHLDPRAHLGGGPALLERLRPAVRPYAAQQLQAFEAHKRLALAAALRYDTRKRLLASLVEMPTQLMTAMRRAARHAWDKEPRQVRQRRHPGVLALRALAETGRALSMSPEAPLSTVLAHIEPHRIAGALEAWGQCERLERHGLLEQRPGQEATLRRSCRAGVDLPCATESGHEALLANVARLRPRHRGARQALPPEAATSCVPVAWRGSLQANEPRWRRPWERALALRLQEALRSGDGCVPDSHRHVSFWHLC